MRIPFDPSLAALSLALVLTRAWEVGYPILSMEMFLSGVLALLLAATLTRLTARSGPVRTGALALLFTGLLVTFFVHHWLVAILVLINVPMFAAALYRHVQPQFFLVCAFVFLGLKFMQDLGAEPPRNSQVQSPPAAEMQILVHWVMDEMGSFDSVPDFARNQAEIEEIRNAYLQRGFLLHEGLSSISPETSESLGALVDLQGSPTPGANVIQLEGRNAHRVIANSLHRRFVEEGWGVSITQSSYLDFCTDEAFACSTYNVSRDAHVVADAGMSITQRASILMAVLTSPARDPWRRASPTLPLTVLKEIRSAARQTRELRGKHYVFAHFLLPHFPWALGRDCAVKAAAKWRLPYSARKDESDEQAQAFAAYWEQSYCTHRELLQVVDSLDALFPGRVRFLIHGDHGPRIMARTLPKFGQPPVGEQVRRNVMEPFIASRVGTRAELPMAETLDMQAFVRRLLLVEAGVPSYALAP